ncbi:hypothetical protein RM553_18760 [Zunongwangia sp. F363]|uniref:Uncharacterized protein n=1 Tax=Autumnicola tepida TaxID=3075595 RepID=A0ABU3CEW1_9FLAO|nr:hypothetical protein [Zunongwangia sp. F363]MDT0644886.1 hypothetical protein [Zunongwangia sp. F363]
MKKVLLAFIFLMPAVFLAQVTIPFSSDRGMVVFTREKEPENYTGSPYMEEDFQRGIIHDEQGRTMGALMRYNAIEDVVLIKLQEQDEESYVLPKKTNITYELPGYTYFIDNIQTDNGNKESFFARYYKGEKSDFIGVPKLDIIPAQKAKTGYDKDRPTDIDVEMVYYIALDNNFYRETRLKEKDLKKFFTSSAMEEYFKSHKIKDVKDVIEMLKYYESTAS